MPELSIHRDNIKRKLELLRTESPSLAVDEAFETWLILGLHMQDSRDEDDIGNAILKSKKMKDDGGSGDGGVDAWYSDEETDSLYLYQAYWPDESQTAAPVEKAIKTKSIISYLESFESGDRNYDSQPNVWQSLIDAYREVRNNQDATIYLRLVSGGQVTSPAREEMAVDINISLGCEIKQEAWDVAELANFVSTEDLRDQERQFEIFPNTEKIHYQSTWEHVTNSYFAILSSRSLVEVLEQDGRRLVALNVRHSLASGANKVNKRILKDLRKENGYKKFIYGHNGIKITCEKIDDQGGVFTLTNPQVVNGCQTMYTLKDFFKGDDTSPPDPADKDVDIPISALMIQINQDESSEDTVSWITMAANNQTPVKEADLMANDPRQKLLQDKLKMLIPKWFYERKLNEWNSLGAGIHVYKAPSGKKQDRLIRRDIYQQAWRAYTGDPSGALSQKKKIWDQSDLSLFKRVFTPTRRACDVVLVHKLWNFWIKMFQTSQDNIKVAALNNGYSDEIKQKLRPVKTLTTAHAVAACGYAIEKEFGNVCDIPEETVWTLANSFDCGKDISNTTWDSSDWQHPGPPHCGKFFRFIAKMMKDSYKIMIQNIQNDDTLTITNMMKNSTAFTIIKNEINTYDDPLEDVMPN